MRNRPKKLVAGKRNDCGISFESAREAGFRKIYYVSPLSANKYREEESIFTHADGRRKYGVEHVVYSTATGESRYGDSIHGVHHGIRYHLVPGDYLNFKPEKILD